MLGFLATALLLTQSTKPQVGIKVPYEKYTLSNGMKVILHVDKTLPVATINTWFYVGSKDEPEGRSGFAHLFEHLMFMGTKRVPNGQFDSIMESAGGYNNASTSEDRTNYYSFGPSNLLPTLLWLDADRLEDLANEMSLKKVDLQRDVVKNERRQNTENTPYGKAFESINGLMYPKSHPYSTSVIGSHEDLSAATVDDVKNFFNTFYVPNNASLVVAGDFEPKLIKPLIEKMFGTLPRRDDPPRKIVQPFEYKSRKVTMVDDVASSKSLMIWHTPAFGKPGDFEMRTAASILGDGPASLLYQKIVVEKGLATEISAMSYSLYYQSAFVIDAKLAPGKNQQDLENAIISVFNDFASNGPTSGQLQRVAVKAEARIAKVLQSLDSKADAMNEYEFYFGNPDYFQRELDTYHALSPSQVVSTFKNVMAKGSLTLRIIPKIAEEKQNSRDEQPTIGPVAPFELPRPTASAGNVKFWYRPNVPLTEIKVLYKFGSENDPIGKEGLTAFTTELMSRGGNKLNSVMFADFLDQYGAEVSSMTGLKSSLFSLSVPSSGFGKVANSFASVLGSPTLDKSDFDQLKAEMIASIEEEDTDPSVVANKVSKIFFFGKESEFSRFATKKSVGSITLEDVKAMASKLASQKCELLVGSGSQFGAINPIIQTSLASVINGKLQSGSLVNSSQVNASKASVVIVDRPKAVQTLIQVLFPGLRSGDEYHLPLNLASIVLGGSFTSRLNANLREEKGFTYGASARASDDPLFGLVTLNTPVKAEVTGASIVEILKELKRIERKDITAAETQKARKIFRTKIIESISTLSQLLDKIASQSIKGSDFYEIDKKLKVSEGIGESLLNDLASKHFDMNKALWVLVGDKDEILKQLKGLGLPEPEIYKL